MPAYVWTEEIVRIEAHEHGSPFPYSRVYLKNDKEHHEYFLDVLESNEEIEKNEKH